ncbi:hypothetical protein KSP40_PGU020266 [Platanthera guangdongensis]|uniref:Uncharacterized protein n=1 Tax=Platanthera guangdongensis TaxID=2320717 RepID=A0ABR2LDZ5_9ASPA
MDKHRNRRQRHTAKEKHVECDWELWLATSLGRIQSVDAKFAAGSDRGLRLKGEGCRLLAVMVAGGGLAAEGGRVCSGWVSMGVLRWLGVAGGGWALMEKRGYNGEGFRGGAVKDSIVGEFRLAQYLLAVLNVRKTPLQWDRLMRLNSNESPNELGGAIKTVLKDSIPNRRNPKTAFEVLYIEGIPPAAKGGPSPDASTPLSASIQASSPSLPAKVTLPMASTALSQPPSSNLLKSKSASAVPPPPASSRRPATSIPLPPHQPAVVAFLPPILEGVREELVEAFRGHRFDVIHWRINVNVLDEDLVKKVQRTLYITFSEFEGNLEEESELESLINMQLAALQVTFRIPHKDSDEANLMVSKKLLILFRTEKKTTKKHKGVTAVSCYLGKNPVFGRRASPGLFLHPWKWHFHKFVGRSRAFNSECRPPGNIVAGIPSLIFASLDFKPSEPALCNSNLAGEVGDHSLRCRQETPPSRLEKTPTAEAYPPQPSNKWELPPSPSVDHRPSPKNHLLRQIATSAFPRLFGLYNATGGEDRNSGLVMKGGKT